jgi:hypothetical protein
MSFRSTMPQPLIILPILSSSLIWRGGLSRLASMIRDKDSGLSSSATAHAPTACPTRARCRPTMGGRRQRGPQTRLQPGQHAHLGRRRRGGGTSMTGSTVGSSTLAPPSFTPATKSTIGAATSAIVGAGATAFSCDPDCARPSALREVGQRALIGHPTGCKAEKSSHSNRPESCGSAQVGIRHRRPAAR